MVATLEAQGTLTVAVAAEGLSGIYLSNDSGKTNTFRFVGLQNEDIRALEVQRDGPRSFLWAGVTAQGGTDDPGKGCFRWELRGTQNPPEGWQPFVNGWKGGSCRALAFQGTTVLAGTHHGGVLRLDSHATTPGWLSPDVNCGLVLRDPDQFLFQRIDSVAVDPQGQLIMVGGPAGVFRSQDTGLHYQTLSGKEFTDSVTLPQTWLFVSGAHNITVVSEDEVK